MYDPILLGKGRVLRFNHDKSSPTLKQKKVSIVKWFEPLSEGKNSNKFLVVFEDGTIYVYFKDSNQTSETAKNKIKTPIENASNPNVREFKEYTRD
jgi:hypothetical protein